MRRSGTDPAPSAFIAKNTQLDQEVDGGLSGDADDIKNKARVRQRQIINEKLRGCDEPLLSGAARIPDSGVPTGVSTRAGPLDARVPVTDAGSRQGACYIISGPSIQAGVEGGFAQGPNGVNVAAVDRRCQKSLDRTAGWYGEKERDEVGSRSESRMGECVNLNPGHAPRIGPCPEIRQVVPYVFGSHILAKFDRQLEVFRRRSHEFDDKTRGPRGNHDIEPVHASDEG